MVVYIHLMDTGNLPSCESCGKMLLTSKSGNQEEQHVLRPCFPEKARPWAFHVCELSIGQDCRKWSPGRCLGSISQLGAVDQQLRRSSVAMARKGGLCADAPFPSCKTAEKPMAKLPQLGANGMRTSMSMCAFCPAKLWHNLVESPRIASAEFGESSKICVRPENAAQSSWRRNM